MMAYIGAKVRGKCMELSNYLNVIESTRDFFFSNFQKNPNFTEASREALKELKSSNYNSIKFDMDFDVTDRWLEPESYDWYYEKPPLLWYSSALAVYFHCIKISAQTRLRLMSAANYYGDFDLVIQLASTEDTITHNIESFYRITQQKAKALKNKGDFNKARSVLRNLLSKAYLERKEAHIAYFLMLYAKLCNDYQQRMGWYFAFHEISYNRMSAIYRNSSQQDKRAIKRWLEVCSDSYAKAVYQDDNSIGEKLYQKLLKNNKGHNDAYVRIKAHLHEARILRIIDYNGPGDIDTLEKNLLELYNLIEIAEKLGNIRATNVRKIIFIKFARIIEEWRLKQNINKKIDIIQQLLEGEAVLEAERVKCSSIFISDWKTAAISAYEKSKWLKISNIKQMERENGKFQIIIDSLNEVIKILTKESEELIPYIYHDVLMALAEAYIELRQWEFASSIYKDAYKYCKSLVEELKKDEEEIINAIGKKEDTQRVPAEIGEEFQVLELKELENIREKLIVDYKLILERLIDIGERINSLQFEQIAKEKQLSRDYRYHYFAERLRHLQSKSEDHPEINAELKRLVLELEEWAKKERELFVQREMHISKKVVKTAIDNDVKLEKYRQHIEIEETGRQGFFVIFNEFLLHILMGTLIINAVESAQRNKIGEFKIRIGIHDDNNIIYLGIQDNTGDIDFLKEVINALNKGLPVTSRRGKYGGKGLALIKKFIKELSRLEQNWELKEIDENSKKIIIPLAQKVERK